MQSDTIRDRVFAAIPGSGQFDIDENGSNTGRLCIFSQTTTFSRPVVNATNQPVASQAAASQPVANQPVASQFSQPTLTVTNDMTFAYKIIADLQHAQAQLVHARQCAFAQLQKLEKENSYLRGAIIDARRAASWRQKKNQRLAKNVDYLHERLQTEKHGRRRAEVNYKKLRHQLAESRDKASRLLRILSSKPC